jgi:pimeloyl-ACP methyl ester carboxylesterase
MVQVHTVRLASGLDVAYVEHGDPAGRPLLLIHPWGESLGSFDRLVPLLPPTMRVLAFDQRGHGDSDKPVDGYALTDLADEVEDFMDRLGLAEAVLVGSSSGGYVAQQVAVVSPRRVTALVLVGAPRSLNGRPSFADDVERLTDPISRSWLKVSLSWFPRFHDVPDWYVEDRVDDGLRMPAHVWRKAFAGLTAAVPPTEVGSITAPTLILWGDRDDLLPRDEQEQLVAAIPGSQLLVYADTGHLVLWEQPDRVAADLVDFVERL